MSELLDSVSRDFSRRLTVRRGMMGHLGLHPSDAETLACRADIRETLRACACCANPDVCEGWVAQGRSGTPMFCRARDAFLRLQAALDPPQEIRRRA